MKLAFEWDDEKSEANVLKHGVTFKDAQEAFFDPFRIIAEDLDHSTSHEKRFFCFGRVHDDILTVRFTHRGSTVRIFGAGKWRKGRRAYEQRNGGLHRR